MDGSTANYVKGELLPDGSDPYSITRTWGPYVVDCLRLLDGDGTYRHWKYGMDYSQQPWIDLQIYDVIRHAYTEYRNRKNKDAVRKSGVSPRAGHKPAMHKSHRRRR